MYNGSMSMRRWLVGGAVVVAAAALATEGLFFATDESPAGVFDGASDTGTVPVVLFYYDAELDKDAEGNVQCGEAGMVPVGREILVSKTPIQDAVSLLLRGGVTPDEARKGLSTGFPLPGVALTGASLHDGELTLSFADPGNRTSGGSCRAKLLWTQIAMTAKQFPDVQRVRFAPEYLFQP